MSEENKTILLHFLAIIAILLMAVCLIWACLRSQADTGVRYEYTMANGKKGESKWCIDKGGMLLCTTDRGSAQVKEFHKK